MANFTNVANELTKKFIRAKNKKYALNQIIYDINHHVYSTTKEPLSYLAKVAIVRHIFEVTAGRKSLVLVAGERLSPNFSDILIFLRKKKFYFTSIKSRNKTARTIELTATSSSLLPRTSVIIILLLYNCLGIQYCGHAGI